MDSARRFVAAALTAPLLLLAAPAAAQEARIAWWSGDYDAAYEEAKVRNVPLVFVFIQDGEEANERIVTGVFPDNEYVAAMRRAVAVVLSHEAHALKKEVVDGESKGVCAKFGGCPCEAHKRLEPLARAEFFTIGEGVQTPQHLFVLPDRTIFDRILDVAAPGAYVDVLKKAQAKLGRGIGRTEFLAAKKATTEARRLLEAKEYAPAHKAAKAAADGVKGTKFGEDLEAVIAAVERAATARLEEASSVAKNGDAYRALKLLDAGAGDFAGTTVVPAMKKEAERVRNTKAGREAAALISREARAAPVWAAAEKAISDRDYLRAKREFEKVAKLAAGAPLATEAEKRLAALAADPELKVLFEKADREAKADAALKAAEALLRDGGAAKGRPALEGVVKDYADTKAAEAAKRRLAELK